MVLILNINIKGKHLFSPCGFQCIFFLFLYFFFYAKGCWERTWGCLRFQSWKALESRILYLRPWLKCSDGLERDRVPFSPLLSTWSCPSSLCSHGLRVWPQSIVFHGPGGYRCQNWLGEGTGHPKALIPQKGLVLMRYHQIHSSRRDGEGRSNRKGLNNQNSWGEPQILMSALLPFWNKEPVAWGVLKKTLPFSRDHSPPRWLPDPLPLAASVYC